MKHANERKVREGDGRRSSDMHSLSFVVYL
jgi:hypothetical protein